MSAPQRGGVPAAWAPLIADYLLSLTAAGQPATTAKLRRMHLHYMARGLGVPPHQVTGERLVAWFGSHPHWKPETRRSYRTTARSFFRWAHHGGRLPEDLTGALPKVRQPKPSARPAPDQAWRTALMAADPRVTLMLRLAGEAGLRRAEVAKIHTGDLVEGVDGWSLLVHGKGGRKRVVPIGDDLAARIAQGAPGHTPERGRGVPGRGRVRSGVPGYLFPGGDEGHLTPGYVGLMVTRVLPDGWTMHSLRHRMASRAYRGTRNLRAVQVILGHENLNTTQRYLAVDDAEIRAAMEAAAGD